MAAKVFQIQMTLATNCKFNSNTVKSNIGKLLKMGKAAQVISNALTPIKVSGAVASYLSQKSGYVFYKSELLILTKTDKFPSGENISSATLRTKVADVIPLLNDKKSEEPLSLDLIEIKCSKL